MSGINGDKSRFHRKRKQKIQRRKETQKLLSTLSARSSAGTPPSSVKTGRRTA